MREHDDDYDDREEDDFQDRSPPYPALLKTAGFIWIGFGVLILLNTVLTFAWMGVKGLPGGSSTPVVSLIIGIIFLHVGKQSILGEAKGTLGNGVGSIILGALYLAVCVVFFWAGALLFGAIAAVACAGLILAGVLALVAGKDYQEWRRFNKKRKQTRFDDDDDRGPRRPRHRTRDDDRDEHDDR